MDDFTMWCATLEFAFLAAVALVCVVTTYNWIMLWLDFSTGIFAFCMVWFSV
jgi:hypothetical protein